MLLSACSGGAAANSHAKLGRPAPNWTEPTAGGSSLTLASLRGKPVYLNFFATWCGPCNEEAPYINDLQKTYAGRGLQIVGVDELESKAKAQEFIKKYGLVYPAVVDDGTLQSQYSVNGLPVHVFIDRSGTIKNIVVGEMNKTEIGSAIRAIL
ncbi:MAG TPA: TlpA disulfide reductase family protein [Candidatus Baltobacteraceae bacterium]|nr:TlpA disulfide reductase family protein [Candidatus Baltobacteraceae bacterium]